MTDNRKIKVELDISSSDLVVLKRRLSELEVALVKFLDSKELQDLAELEPKLKTVLSSEAIDASLSVARASQMVSQLVSQAFKVEEGAFGGHCSCEDGADVFIKHFNKVIRETVSYIGKKASEKKSIIEKVKNNDAYYEAVVYANEPWDDKDSLKALEMDLEQKILQVISTCELFSS